MTRTIQDRNLEIWEAYAAAGDSGTPERSRIVFYCLSDRTRRARAVARDADRAAVEREVAGLPDPELRSLLEQARELK